MSEANTEKPADPVGCCILVAAALFGIQLILLGDALQALGAWMLKQ